MSDINAGTVKAEVVVEYDGSGIKQAKEDLQSLADMGGNAEQSLAGTNDALAGTEELAGRSAEATRSFTSAIGELPKMVDESTSGIAEMTDALSEHQQAIDDTAQSLTDIQEPLRSYNESLQAVSETMSSPHLTENLSAFQDALENPYPFSMIGQYLKETGQTWGDFTDSIGENNTAFLHEMATNADTTYQVLGGMSGGFEQVGKSATENIGSIQQAMAEFNAADPWTTMASGAEEASKSMGSGGFFGDLFNSTEEVGALWGSGGLMGMLGDFMMPMFAVQMISMGVSTLGANIYDAAVIAEGPAAHGVGTFTGAIDTLNQSAQKTGQAFSEGFGQGVLPALNAVNDTVAQNSGGFNFWGWLGQGLGMEGGIVTDFAQVIGGVLGSSTQMGQDWFNAGANGLANYWADWTGQPEPYPGPTPPSQSQIYYQQQMANLPNTIQMSGAQLQAQGTTTLAEAADPNWESAYNQYTADQRASQYLIQQYQSRHPINIQQAIQQAQYDDYAAQQEQLYQEQTGQGPGAGPAGQSSPLDFLTGFGPASVAGWQGQGGPTYGQAIGGAIQDFFTKGFGSDLMQFFGGTGGTGGGPTWGQAISGGISSLWGNLGAILNGSAFSQPAQSYSGGCFPAGTRVLMADHSERPIESLCINDHILAHNGTQHVTAHVVALITPPPKQTYALTFDDGNTLTLTDSHPVATQQGWKSLSPEATQRENPDLAVTPLAIGDTVITVDGQCRLVAIQAGSVVQVYNIEVSDPHVFYANGVLVHNKFADVGQQTADQIQGIQLPHMDLSGISSQLAGNFGGIQLPHLDLSGLTADLAGNFGNIQMPHLDLSGITSSLAGEFSNIQMPSLNLSGITSSLSGAFSDFQLPSIPDIGGQLSSELGGMFTSFQLPSLPDIGGMLSGALGGVFGNFALPSLPDIGGMINSTLSGMFNGISLPSLPNIAGSINSELSGLFSGISIPSIPFFASGVQNYTGLGIVGENGPELVSLNGGSVFPLSAGVGMGGGMTPISLDGGGGDSGMITVNITHVINLDGAAIAQATVPYIAPLARVQGGMRGY